MAKMKIQIDPKHIADVCATLFATEGKTATKYLSEKLVVRATWQFKPSLRHAREDMRVTFGAPNFMERNFVKACKKAGEPFPPKAIQLKAYPKPRVKKT